MKSPAEIMHIYLHEVAIAERLALLDEIAAADVVDEANQIFGGPPGRSGLVAHVQGFQRNVQNCKIRVERIVGDRSEAMAWWSFTGIHSGPWLGKPATGAPVAGTVVSCFDVAEGLIMRYRLWLHAEFVDCSAVFDTTTQQLPRFTEYAS